MNEPPNEQTGARSVTVSEEKVSRWSEPPNEQTGARSVTVSEEKVSRC